MRRSLLILAVVAALIPGACSERDPGGADPGDTLPPSVISVQAWDITHVVLTFDERVTRESADNPEHYTVGYAGNGIAFEREDTLNGVLDASLHSDNRTVTLTTDSLAVGDFGLIVNGVSDVYGNALTMKVGRIFDGTTNHDVTPPEVAYQIPAPGAVSVPTGTFVSIGFTEAVRPASVIGGLHVTGEGARLVSISYDDLLHYTCDLELLEPNTQYTVALTGVQDLAGNTLPETSWIFDTAKTLDTTAPRVVSSTPSNFAVNVGTSTSLTITFSEPMDPNSVKLRPPIDVTTKQWTNGWRKLVCTATWDPNTQYTVQIRPAEMRDLAGNTGKLFTLTFSTGAALATGGLAGTIQGDINSVEASNPAGGLVFAGPMSPFDLFTSVVATVAANGSYTIPRLPAQSYFPFYVVDSNGDHLYQPNFGDAIGIYGVNIWESDVPQLVDVRTSVIGGINFKIHDPSAVYGLLAYNGRYGGVMYVGLFATGNFDPATSVPVVSTAADAGGIWDYLINSLVSPIAPGNYYVAAFLDANQSNAFEYGIDPLGVYGGATPIAVDLSHGRDAPATSFELTDPVAPVAGRSVQWPVKAPSSRLKPFLDALDPSSGERPKISNH